MSNNQQQSQKEIKQRIKQILPKLKCAFHENQTLTNFCSCKKCLLPLCPSCIKIHTIQHVNMKTDPQYDSIQDVIFGLQTDLKSFASMYEQGYQMFNQVQQKVTEFKQEIWKSIENLKKSIINEVQIYFKGVTQAAQQKISKMPYIQQLQIYKLELKKTNTIIKGLQKNLTSSSCSGKHLIRNLIKYQSNSIQQHLQKFDSQSQEFITKLQGNFCTLSIRQNLKENLLSYLAQIFKININQIPVLNKSHSAQDDSYENGVCKISKKMQIFTNDQKSNQKVEVRNSLTTILSKATEKNANQSNKSMSTHNNKKLNQSQINDKENRNMKQQNKNIEYLSCGYEQSSSGFRNILSSNQKRSFTNHSSQRKSLNVSGRIDADMSCINLGQNNSEQRNADLSFQNSQISQMNSNSRYQRKSSTSKGKGLTLIHSNNNLQIPESKYLRANNGVRFSLSSIDNVNLDLVSSKPIYINRRK